MVMMIPISLIMWEMTGYDDEIKEICARHLIGRIGKPEEIAALAAYLDSNESGFMTGQAIAIDGGSTI